jgi:hypothetical protein
MRASSGVVPVLVLVGCGAPAAEEKTTDTDRAPTWQEVDTATTDTGTGTTDPADDVPVLPTDVTEDCWAWGLQYSDDTLVAELLYFYDPVTLDQTHYQTDYDLDGDIDYAWDVTYDPVSGETASVRYDRDGDGVSDEVIEYEHDAAGLRTRFSHDLDGDGQWEEVWTYDYVGDLRSFAYADEGDDGTTDVWYTYVRDAADRLVRFDGDRGNDGVIDSIVAYTYADLVTSDYTYTVDEDADGVVEETRTYAYDEHERLITYTYDLDDGTSSVTNYGYSETDASEDVLSAHGTALYPDQEEYAFVSTYTYEAPGKLSRAESTYTFEGSTPFVQVEDRVWTCP